MDHLLLHKANWQSKNKGAVWKSAVPFHVLSWKICYLAKFKNKNKQSTTQKGCRGFQTKMQRLKDNNTRLLRFFFYYYYFYAIVNSKPHKVPAINILPHVYQANHWCSTRVQRNITGTLDNNSTDIHNLNNTFTAVRWFPFKTDLPPPVYLCRSSLR